MQISIDDFMTWFILIESLLGLGISIYNWILMHKSADIRPQGLMELGIKDVGKGFMLEVPILVTNVGFQPGMVTWLDISLKGSKGKNSLKFGRRVELNVGATPPKFMHPKHFQEIVPSYPINIPPQQSATLLLEFYDYKEKPALIFDEPMTCEISIFFDADKMRSIKFPLRINTESFANKPYLVWVPVSGDSQFKKYFLMDTNDNI